MKRAYDSQKGSVLIEFVIVLPLLLVITFAIIEFGVFLYNRQVITNASREGARAGIVSSIPRLPVLGADSIDSVVQNFCVNHLITFDGSASAPTTSADGYAANATFGTVLTVQVDYNYSFLVLPDLLAAFFGSSFNKTPVMHAETAMRYE